MAGSECTRRRFIQHAGASGTLLVFGFALPPLGGCGGEADEGDRTDNGAGAAGDDAKTGSPPSAKAEVPCRDLTGLSSEEKEWRDECGYVDQTPDPAQRCDNCEFWEAPRGSAVCGGCTVMAGPIAPGAYCDLWEASA
jgi:hypothetical protein